MKVTQIFLADLAGNYNVEPEEFTMAVTKEMRALTKAHEDAVSAHQEETKKLEERVNVARGKPQGCNITLEHLSTDRWRVLFHGLTEEEMLGLVEELAPAEKAGN